MDRLGTYETTQLKIRKVFNMQNNMLVRTIRKVEWGGGSGGNIDYALRKPCK